MKQFNGIAFLKKGLFAFGTICFGLIIIDSIQHIQSEVYHRSGFIKLERNYPQMAAIDFKKATNLMPWENHYRLQLAKSLEAAAKKFETNNALYKKYTSSAIQEYEILIKYDPINPWYKARLGLIYHELFKKNPTEIQYKIKAQELAKAATDNDKKNPLFTMHYGHFLYTYNDIKNAKKYYIQTITYDPDLMEAHFNLAAIYTQEGNADAAINHYKIVTKSLVKIEQQFIKNPKQTELRAKIDRFQNARIEVAKHYLNKFDHEAAFELIVLIPESVEKYELLALYYDNQGQPQTALSLYRQLKKSVEADLNQTLKNPSIDEGRAASLKQKINQYTAHIYRLQQ